MSIEAVARRYARAIFEIGRESKQLDAFAKELTAIADTYSASDELQDAMSSPMLGDAAREGIIADIAKRHSASPQTTNLLRLLARRRRLVALPELVVKLSELVDEHKGILRATVRAASKLTPAYLDKLKAKIEQATGRKVIVTFQDDPALIAGVVTQIGDQVVDGSVRGRIEQLRESLHQT